MRRWLTNRLLLAVILGLGATGLIGWILPVDGVRPAYDLHRLLGAALVLLLIWKQAVAIRSLRWRLPRGDRSVLLGGTAAALLLASAGLGFAWTLGLATYTTWGYSPLNVHVQLGIGLLPLALWHLLRRREGRPNLGSLLSRRALFRLGGVSLAALAGWQALDRVAALRRFTGSKHAVSFSGNDFPVTNWTFDGIPEVDPGTWRLAVRGKLASPGETTLDGLPVAEVDAVLDCTGGWWSEQRWRGVRVGDILAPRGLDPAAREARVVSITGHAWTFPVDELRQMLLATHVGGEPIDPGHGYPARLVAPGRRGFQWVKWVREIEIA